MAVAQSNALLTRVTRIYMLSPFQKALAKRHSEVVLLHQLADCVDRLSCDPLSPGLNVETLFSVNQRQVLSARITQSFRLIFVPLARTEIGLLYFDNHDEAYAWVDRHRSTIPALLTPVEEIDPAALRSGQFAPVRLPRLDEDSPLVIENARQFAEMVEQGVVAYLSYLDEDQRRLVDLKTSGLLLVKGGAGTGKTAVAIHRVLALARQPTLMGPSKVLYLCYNRVLASAVGQMLDALSGGTRPPQIEVRTFHAWCRQFLGMAWGHLPQIQPEECQRAVRTAFGNVDPAGRLALAAAHLNDRFVDDEIVQVIKHNGLTTLDQYLSFNRRGRSVALKRAAREAIWQIYRESQAFLDERGIYRWEDLPILALQALDTLAERPVYRAIIIDEAQDCSPVIIRLARRLLPADGGILTVFADPAQAIYENGFQWTQREIRPAGGNVHWLRKTYRTTREIYDLARPLLDGQEDLCEDLAQMQPPDRRGPRPTMLVTTGLAELLDAVVDRVAEEVRHRPANQIGVLAGSRDLLEQIQARLQERNIASTIVRNGNDLISPSVKLLTFHSAKGLDFPVVVLVGPRKTDLGGQSRASATEARRALYVALTRASYQMVIGIVDGEHHPLVESLDGQHCSPAGSRGVAFVNLHSAA